MQIMDVYGSCAAILCVYSRSGGKRDQPLQGDEKGEELDKAL